MTGSLLNKAKSDAIKYVTKGGFEENIQLQTADGNTTLDTTGLASKHHINFDTDGNSVNSKNAHICLSEQDLIDNAYPYRNADEEVDLLRHKVNVKDSSGIIKNYVIIETFPSETVGLIICILGDYEPN